MSPIRVLHFLPLFDTGGTEKVVMDIYNGLDAGRFESHVCTFFHGKYDRFFKGREHLRHVLVSNGCQAPTRKVRKGINMILRLNRLRRVIRQTRAQVVHTHHLGPLLHVGLLETLIGCKLGWIHTEHNVPDLDRGYSQFIYRIIKPLSRPAYVTGVSANVCAYLDRRCGVLSERIKMIPNGVDLGRFGSLGGGQRIRGELGLSPDDEVIGCIGNLRLEKNQRLAIEALSLLEQRRPRLKLLICGDGECRAELERLAELRGVRNKTVFLGYRFDILDILSALDLFCLPSLYEGMPVSVLEAWAASKPIVATDVIGIRDIITHGINGMLVPPDEPKAMADAIDRLLDDKGRMLRIASDGRKLVAEKYSVEAMVLQYANLYEKLARN